MVSLIPCIPVRLCSKRFKPRYLFGCSIFRASILSHFRGDWGRSSMATRVGDCGLGERKLNKMPIPLLCWGRSFLV